MTQDTDDPQSSAASLVGKPFLDTNGHRIGTVIAAAPDESGMTKLEVRLDGPGGPPELMPHQEQFVRDTKDRHRASLAEAERRRAEGPPLRVGKSMLTPGKLMALQLAAGLLPIFGPVGGQIERERALQRELSELVSALSAAGHGAPDDVAWAINEAVAGHGFELTPERVALWTGAVTRGETGLTEILIALEPPPVGMRGKGDYGIVDEATGWDHATAERVFAEYEAGAREVIDSSIVPEELRDESERVMFRSAPSGRRERLKREINLERKKSTFAQRARRLMR